MPFNPNAKLLRSPRELVRSAAWATAIAVPLLFWGASASMALAHVGGPLVILFAPVVPVLLLFGSGGVFAGAPEWAFNVAACAAQFAGTFAVVHAFRSLRAMPPKNDA
jgi:hypothetical protein